MNDNDPALVVGSHGDLADRRLVALHYEHQRLDDLAADLGTPEEWLAAAVEHLKLQTSGARRNERTTVVTTSAIDLLLIRLEQLQHGARGWRTDD